MLREILVPAGLIAILGSMLLPLPAVIIDFLLVVNLIGALVLVTSALYVSNPIKLSTLPSLLLLATLFRLALNISTTRMILSAGDAGFMIKTFGELLMQNNLIVGAVVFLVVTLVQLIVIAKGAERVAEVSARFTLDALPGKQMSIDADIRSGLLGLEEAREKRQELQVESRFYGALDGAMKFVKGDAIAGIVITAINIIGGFAIGSLVIGLDLGVALNKYTLLTIGDGLLSQIPALLNSIAAGIIITRVVKDEESSLATELFEQLCENNKAKVLVGIIALLLAAIPGTPILPFVFLAVLLLGGAFASSSKARKMQANNEEVKAFQPRTPSLIELRMTREVLTLFPAQKNVEKFFHELLEEVYSHTGLILPVPEFTLDQNNDEPMIAFFLRGIQVSSLECRGPWEELESLLKEYFLNQVQLHRTELIDDTVTRRIIDMYESQAPELVANVIPGIATVTQISSIIRELLKENISARNIDVILQAVSENGSKIDDHRFLMEEIRIALGRMIVDQFTVEKNLNIVRVDPIIDMTLVHAENTQEPIDSEYMQKMCEAFMVLTDEPAPKVICVSRRARRLLGEFMKAYNIPGTVIAFEEIPSGVVLNQLGTIAFQDEFAETIMEQMAA